MGQLFDDMEEVHVYTAGLCSLSVCAPKEMPVERVEDAVNAGHPTGLEYRWKVAKDKNFRTGEPNPCPCNDEPEDRLHYLMHC